MSDDDLTIIGERIGYGGLDAGSFGIRRADRRQHLYAIGKTGTGKTTLLEHMILQDIASGEGVALIDIHGDVSERLLHHIPPWRADHLCYFDPADPVAAIGYNPLACVSAERRHLAVSGFVGACHGIWGDSWGASMDYIFKNAVAALIELPGTTLLSLKRFLSDDGYRARLIERLTDPVVASYWRDEFMRFGKRERADRCAPILNKVGQFLLSDAMRHVFGQEHSAFDLRFTMDNRRILIANLSKGKIGADNARLISAFLVASCELAASSRADVPEEKRETLCPDFYLYADEFQNIVTDSFADILSEARKYRLCLALFHQFEDQLDEAVRRAVFGNVGTLIAFRVGQRDAEHLSRELQYELTAEDLTDLKAFEIAVRLLRRGTQEVPFRAKTTLPDAPFYGERENMITQSRMRFGKPCEKVARTVERATAQAVPLHQKP